MVGMSTGMQCIYRSFYPYHTCIDMRRKYDLLGVLLVDDGIVKVFQSCKNPKMGFLAVECFVFWYTGNEFK